MLEGLTLLALATLAVVALWYGAERRYCPCQEGEPPMPARGTVVSFDAGTHTAAIRLDGSAAQTLTGVPTARNIASGEMTAGRRVVLDAGETGELEDLVVLAVYAL